MHSSVIGKVEKTHRYARERDRISVETLSLSFRGDNDTHRVTFGGGAWQCTCHYFDSRSTCAHVLAMQDVLGVMLPDEAQTSLFPAAPDAVAEPART
jgi:hypothetical protein